MVLCIASHYFATSPDLAWRSSRLCCPNFSRDSHDRLHVGFDLCLKTYRACRRERARFASLGFENLLMVSLLEGLPAARRSQLDNVRSFLIRVSRTAGFLHRVEFPRSE